jgi:hypothetical protein
MSIPYKEKIMSDLQVMLEHFEALRTDIFEGILNFGQRIERVEEKTQTLEAEKIADRIVMHDIRDSLRKWETKIPELVHGSVKQCMEFEISALKKTVEEHLKSDDPHPAIGKSKKAARRKKIELAIAASSSAGLLLLIKFILSAFGINI